MTIDQLGSLGEFVSSVAVVLSLIYVAIQLKQNTNEMKRMAFRDVYQSYSSIRRSVYTDTGIASLLIRAQDQSPKLTAEEELKLENYYNEQLFCTVQLMNSADTGQLAYTSQAWTATIAGVIDGLDSELFRNYWAKWKSIYPETFVAQLDEALMKAGT